MLNEYKVESSVCRKKRFRGRRNPKQRKYRKKKLKKFQMEGSERRHKQGCDRENTIGDCYGEAFWYNYRKAIDWTTSYTDRYWKEQALRLQEENARLRNRLQSLTHYGHQMVDGPSEDEEECGCRDATDTATTDFEVTQEFMQFIEASLKHKSSRKKKKGMKVGRSDDEEVGGCQGTTGKEVLKAPEEDNCMRRCYEMKELYGRDSAKIQGMETAVHLAFLRKCDKSKPVVWPVVPLAPLNYST